MHKETYNSEDARETSRAITKSAGVVGAATLLSRIFGYVRDLVLASLFGTGMAADAFFMAFTIPNLMRRLFSEGSLSIAFIPVYTYFMERHGRSEADRFAGCALRITALAVSIVSAIGVWMAPFLVGLLAFGWSAAPEKIQLCITLTRVMMPYILFVSLVALCMGILNVLGHFAAPALSPACLNISIIAMAAMAAFMSAHTETRVLALAVGVLAGGMLQLAIQVPVMARHKFHFKLRGPVWHPGMKRILRLMGPTVFGVAVYQINTVVLRFMASTLDQGAVSYLYYADRLVQFPLGVFGIATATAILPALSHQAVNHQWSAVRDSFGYAMRFVFFISLPSMAGLIVLREPIVRLLFTYGAFDDTSMRLTAGVLLYYGIGLWAFAGVRIVLNTFYALQDARTPVLIGTVSIGANLLFGVALIGGMRQNGLAFALSLSSMLNLVLLMAALHKRLGGLGWRRMAASFTRSAICSALMAMAVCVAANRLVPAASSSRTLLFGVIVLCIVIGIAVFGCLSFIFRVPELQVVMQIVKYKGSKKR